MRTAGKIVLWLGILIITVVGIIAGLSLVISASSSNSEALGWAMALGLFVGMPALVFGGILILIGAVLVTSAAAQLPKPPAPPPHPPAHINANKSRYQSASPPRGQMRSDERALRSALTAGTSNLHTVALLIRVAAIGVFVWLFVPETYDTLKLYSYMAIINWTNYALLIGVSVVFAAIIPMIMWLVSNLIKIRANAADGHLA